MMKKIFFVMSAACFAAPLAHGQSNPPVTAVTVDMAKVYANYDRAERSREQFQEAVERAQEELRTMLNDGVAMAKELRETEERMGNQALSEAAVAKLRKQCEEKAADVRKKEVEVNTFRQQTDKELSERRDELFNRHIGEIKKAIRKISEKRKVTVALNTSGGDILYALPTLDISDEVITYLNGDK
ncbi:MAG: OmpH family outer membrane protein [Puniceicoccales bacterium]|nr:OmpH family outer membrane protein [Puniceicoccales bacterium]